jgi:hypothetical protein
MPARIRNFRNKCLTFGQTLSPNRGLDTPDDDCARRARGLLSPSRKKG